ncbi:HD-GYP domain-containing protein [Brevibacillus centrosporus]|uniref:HD-GYP domain-containing protein n=1 Tax=Brevibacillus centrosporus TaxID=54910 RepID=UPI002E22E85B|nr:HD-GYP domain-containing protein [Brevibacillus centrosporus]
MALIGRILKENVFAEDGQLLLVKGVRLDSNHLRYLEQRNVVLTPEYLENVQEETVRKQQYLVTEEKVKSLFHLVADAKLPPLLEFNHTFYPLFHQYVKNSRFLYEVHELEGTDEYTYRHSINVGILTGIIAKLIGLKTECIEIFALAGFFHDLGKLKIPRAILLKDGGLSQDEFAEIRNHPRYGYEMLKALTDDAPILDGALYHHERMDGSGYPYGKFGMQTPEVAQIVAVADVFDAISSNRSYKGKKTIFQAGIVLESEMYKQKLNPRYVIPFLKYLSESFIGHRVIFEDGRNGKVVLCYPDEPLRPLVMLEGECCDLRKNRDLFILDILDTV